MALKPLFLLEPSFGPYGLRKPLLEPQAEKTPPQLLRLAEDQPQSLKPRSKLLDIYHTCLAPVIPDFLESRSAVPIAYRIFESPILGNQDARWQPLLNFGRRHSKQRLNYKGMERKTSRDQCHINTHDMGYTHQSSVDPYGLKLKSLLLSHVFSHRSIKVVIIHRTKQPTW